MASGVLKPIIQILNLEKNEKSTNSNRPTIN
jgi:hypothetical protein